MILPFIQEYSEPINQRPIENKQNAETRVKTIRTYDVYDYIYLLNDNELLEFKVELDYRIIANVLTEYINNQDQSKKTIMSEKDAEKTDIPLKFLCYLGKDRLKNNLTKSKNYLVPEMTSFLKFLTNKYDNEVLTFYDLYDLNSFLQKYSKTEMIKDLFQNINIELVDKYIINSKEIELTISNIRVLLGDRVDTEDVLRKLNFILSTAQENEIYINNLELKDKFDKIINKNKVKVKN